MTKRSPSERLTAPEVLEELTRLTRKSKDEEVVIQCNYRDGLVDPCHPLHLATDLVQDIISKTPTVDFSLKPDGLNQKFLHSTAPSDIDKLIEAILDTVPDVALQIGHYNGATLKSRAVLP